MSRGLISGFCARRQTLLAIEEIISNNPFGVAFSSEDVTRFGTCELKSSSDHGDCTVSSDFSGNGLYVKLASSLLSEGMGIETLHYGICPIPASLAFDGGLYMPTQKPTCGGNADGAPCYLSYTDDLMSEDLLNTQCFIPINEDRRICYTGRQESLGILRL